MIPPIVYISLVFFVIGSISGYKTKSVFVNANEAKLLKLQALDLRKAEETNVKLVRELIINEAENNIIYETKIKEVPVYITKIQKEDSDCNLSVGSVKLFNDAVKPLREAKKELKDVRESSEIREADLVKYSFRLLKKYKDAQSRHNLLIQWHREND